MTDIERLARLAGLQSDGLRWYSRGPGKCDDQDVTHADLTRFAELVRADERERCAKLCEKAWVGDSITDDFAPGDGAYNEGRRDCAAAIRGY